MLMTRLYLLLLTLLASLLTSLEAAIAQEPGGVIDFSLPGETLAVHPGSPPSPPPTPAAAPAPAAPPIAISPSQTPVQFGFDAPPPAPPAPVATAAALPPPTPAAPPSPAAPPPAAPSPGLARLFRGGSNSLVARAVGHAEGTRTATGGYTRAYRGHVDPGNGVWNLGTFSFQHCRERRYNCSTPQEADHHQLQRLQRQAQQLRQRAAALGFEMTLEEELNAIDLVNQSPRAALARQEAYPEHLARARRQGLQGQRAILEGRVWAYWDGERGRWAAPGLGNTERGIRRDQRRRMLAVAEVLAYDQRQQGELAQRERGVDRILAQSPPKPW